MLSSMKTESPAPAQASTSTRTLTRIAAGVNGFPEGDDAATLAAGLAGVTGAELMLIAVHPWPVVVLPPGMDWNSLRDSADAVLRRTSDAVAPAARMVIETDQSVPRGLHRLVRQHHRDLLVLGSSRHAPAGRVRIGKRTRQLLGEFDCPLAVAPRGWHERPDPMFARIAVGYDGGREADSALETAALIARQAKAELQVHAVLDDRVPPTGWSPLDIRASSLLRVDLKQEARGVLEQQTRAATSSVEVDVEVKVHHGRPATALLELSHDVDLLVIGSRRWGPLTRVVLGSTGEALLHDAPCPVLTVPRPHA